MRFSLWFRCRSVRATDIAIESRRACSSSSQSETVVPASTVPSLFTAPDWNRRASTSDDFPTPRYGTTATLRILAAFGHGLALLLGSVSAAKLSRDRSNPASVRAVREPG